MIKRQHVESNFFTDAELMRESLDARFREAYIDSIPWFYFCDPRMYTYLRTMPQSVFPQALFERFMQRLRSWCVESLGLTPMGTPHLHLMVNGCRLGLHSDFHNGTWGYVFSLTRWEGRKFSGGETLLLRDGVPSYKKHHVHGEVLYELIPAQFNQLLIFDDRIVHATPTIEGSMNPAEGRIAMVGHIRAMSPLVSGELEGEVVRKVILDALAQLRDRVRSHKDVQGTITYRLKIEPGGTVGSVDVLTNNIITPSTGYDRADAVASVEAIVLQTMAGLRFPAASTGSRAIVAVLIPVPDLRSIEFSVPHGSSSEATYDYAAKKLGEGRPLGLQGKWEGKSFVVYEPIAGRIDILPHSIEFSFEPPMWVPSQRESFKVGLDEWARSVAASVSGATNLQT